MMKKILAVVIIMLICFTGCGGFATMDKEKNKDSIGSISFSPDGKKILFHRSKGGNPYYMIQVYDLQTGELSAYKSPDGEQWGEARYSSDGKSIVFEILPYKEKQWDIANSQIAIMTPDGRNVRKITSSTGFKIYPSFSHSGKKVIYLKAGAIRKSGKTPAADYDVYEIDLEAGKEIRLTYFKFYEMSAPYYFPDDETIIFSAFGPPFMFPGIAENDFKAIKKKQEELNAKGLQFFNKTGDNVYVVKKGEKILPAPYVFNESDNIDPLINYKGGARDALISGNGEQIYFSAWANKPGGKYGEGQQFYQYSKDRKHRRVSYITPANIFSAALSPNGKSLAIVTSGDSGSRAIVICNIQEGTSRMIHLPDQPSHIINSQ